MKQSHTQGFTLVEMLVYLAVTLLVAVAGVATFLSLNTALIRNQTERALTHAAQATLERMVRDIRGARVVDGAQSTFGTSPGVLEVEDGATTTQFSVSNGRVVVTQNGIELGPLTSDGVSVDTLVFTRYTGTSTELIRIALTLHAESKAASTTRTFYGAAVLRGTYE
jgi:type II secretory pathway pseudopilin PulG